MRRATIYCLDKSNNMKPFEKWASVSPSPGRKMFMTGRAPGFGQTLKPADFNPATTVAIVITEGGIAYYDPA